MRIALLTNFAASKKEPLAAMMGRIHQAFLDAGEGEPVVRFNFGDAPLPGFVSSVDRVLKRHPEMGRFLATDSPLPGFPAVRRISNVSMPSPSGEAVPFSTLHAIAAGVPRSFPFHSLAIHFHSPAFGELVTAASKSGDSMPGVLLTDSWWVNGRNRSLSALTVVEADAGSKKLPPHPDAVAAVLAACGKAKRTVQAPMGEQVAAGAPDAAKPGIAVASANPEAAQAVRAIVADYRARLQQVVSRAALPHDLPPASEARRETGLGVTSGPRKPALERVFKPMGYACRAESGTFTLRRRTAKNLTAQLYLDVGTWSRSVTAIFQVFGVGFRASLPIPVCARDAVAAQYPIGDADQWQKIVENLAALVAELERSFVPEIEAAAGPSPEWYQPES